MNHPRFRVVALPTEIAQAARKAAANQLPDHAIVAADSSTGYPCRHCLRFAAAGEQLVLFPYVSIAPGRPYAESGPIFVHLDPCMRYAQTSGYPDALREGRVLRAYNRRADMIDATVVNGDGIETVIEDLLRNPKTEFLQVRSVSRGCFTMKIERA